MKILFLINMEDLGFEEPLGVLYLSAICRKHNHKLYAVENNIAKVEEKIKSIDPDILAVSVITPNFPYLLETVNKIKSKFNIPTVFGGPHVTFFPEDIIKNTGIDYIIRGEAEEVFVEFLDLLKQGKNIDKVNNLVMRDGNGRIKQNPLKRLIPDLDDLPFPDRELLADYRQFHETDIRSVITSRGCPYNCSYCFNAMIHKMYKGLGKIVRLRSVDNIIEECIELKEIYKAKMIHFFDDIFPYKQDWLNEFVEKYSANVGLPFITNTRFNVCTEEYVKNLSIAGCKTLLIGVEAGNERIRKKVLNRKMSNALMIEKSELLHKYGIKIYTQNIIGIPHGSFETDLETLKLNIDLKADFAGAYLCQPYPKTKIEKIAKDAGMLEDRYEIDRSFYYSSPLILPEKKKIEKLRTIFAFVTNFPFLYNYINYLIRLPDFIIKPVSSLFHGYKIKTIILRYKMGLAVLIKNIKLFFSRRIN